MANVCYDAVVVGGGIAGVKTSIELARCGFTIALIEQQRSLSNADKSLFVDGGKLPPDLLRIGQFHPIPNHKLINADRPHDGWGKQSNDGKASVSFKTGVIHNLPIITALGTKLQSCVDRIEAKYLYSTESNESVTVTFKDRSEKRLTAKHLIDASGDASIVSRNHSTAQHKSLICDDPLVAWMRGLRASGQFDPDTVYDPIGKEIGGTSWVTPLSSTRGDIIASAVAPLSEVRLGSRRIMLDNLVKFCERNGICKVEKVEKQLGGIIRSEPISLRDVKKSTRVWQIGQAAGMADPIMAEAFSPAYLLPEIMVKFISNGRTPADFHNYWRFSNSMFNYDLMLAMLKRRYAYQQRGVVGSNSAIYKLLTKDLSSESVRRALSERRIPVYDFHILASKMVNDAELRIAVLELLGAYTKTVLKENILQRI